MTNYVDVIIIGASIAGSSLGLHLSKNGLSVAVIDAAEFPREKACGEGLSAVGRKELNQLGIADGFSQSPLKGYRIWAGDRSSEIPMPAESSTCSATGVSRYELDLAMGQALRRSSSSMLLLGNKVRDIAQFPDFSEVIVSKTRLRARYLVLADGARSVLANSLNVPTLVHENKRRYSVTFRLDGQWNSKVSEVVDVVLGDGFQACITPIGPSRINVSILSEKPALQRFLDKGWSKVISSSLSSTLGFDVAVASPAISTGPFGRYQRPSHQGNILLVGDSVEQLDPIGGMGMTHALVSSRLAATALTKILLGEESREKAFKTYSKEREAAIRTIRGFTRLSYFTLVHQPNTAFLAPRSLTRAVSQTAHKVSKASTPGHALCALLLNGIGW